jgi:type I restriction enzyme M protein
MNLPQILKRVRERAKFSQSQLAAALGVSFQSVNRWENGHTVPDHTGRRSLEEWLRKLGPDFNDALQEFEAWNRSAATAPFSPETSGGKLTSQLLETIRKAKDPASAAAFAPMLIALKRLKDLRATLPKSADWSRLAGGSGDAIAAKARRALVELSADYPALEIIEKALAPVEDADAKAIFEVLDAARLDKEGLTDSMVSGLVSGLELSQDAKVSGISFEGLESTARWVMELARPKAGERIYDPFCGSGTFLAAVDASARKRGAPPSLYGEEASPANAALAGLRLFLGGSQGQVVLADLLRRKRHRQPDFDLVVSQLMGPKPDASGDWETIRRSCSMLKDGGRAVFLLKGSAAFSKQGRLIRAELVDAGAIEASILLPRLLRSTAMSPLALVLQKQKSASRRAGIMFGNASKGGDGSSWRRLEDRTMEKVADAFARRQESPGLVSIVPAEEVAANDYDLSPARYVAAHPLPRSRDPVEILGELEEIDREAARLEESIRADLKDLGIERSK